MINIFELRLLEKDFINLFEFSVEVGGYIMINGFFGVVFCMLFIILINFL